ncbi:MAG: hypothetical protein IJU44_03650 [Kiritimatiellae bacterium]|nr:hypothetical protein [Kiritimatiellia bacterium]
MLFKSLKNVMSPADAASGGTGFRPSAFGLAALVATALCVATVPSPSLAVNEPDTYLQYVTATGNQYFDLGFDGYSTMTFEADLDWVSGNYFAGTSWNECLPLKNANGKIGGWLLGSGDTASSVALGSGRHHVVSKGVHGSPLSITVDGVEVTSSGTCGSKKANAGQNMYLFTARNNQGTAGNNFNGKLYSLNISTNGVAARSLVPGLKDGVAGLYDTLNDEWLVSTSGTALKAGPEVGAEETYTRLAFVATTGDQYIALGFNGYSTMTLDADIDWISGSYFAGSSWNETYPLMSVDGMIGGQLLNGSDSAKAKSSVALNTGRHKVVSKGVHGSPLSITVDGVEAVASANCGTKGTVDGLLRRTGQDMYLFAARNQSSRFTGRLYSLNISTNGVLARQFVPMSRDSDGAAGLYDELGGVFYTSSSETALVAGPVVTNETLKLVDFVRSSGQQYVDTFITGKAGVKAEIDIDWVSGNSPLGVIGNGNCLLVQNLGGIGGQASGSGEIKAGVALNTGRHIIVSSVGYGSNMAFTLDGTTHTSTGTVATGFTTGLNIWLFGAHNTSGNAWGTGISSVYGLIKMWAMGGDGNHYLAAEFHPCVQDGAAGLYDTVSGGVFFPMGGALTAGPVVEYAEPDVFVEYVESSGSQIVDTGILGKAGVKAEIDIDWVSGNSPLGVIGNGNCLLVQNLDGIGGQASGSGEIKSGVALNTGRHLIVSTVGYDTQMTFTLDGTTYTSAKTVGTGFSTGLHIWLFGAHNVNGNSWGAGTSKVYSLKMWQVGAAGEYYLARHFVPCKKNNRAGLYDAVSGVIFYSTTSTDLTAGPEVSRAVWRDAAHDASLDNADNWAGTPSASADAVVCALWASSVVSTSGVACAGLDVSGGDLSFTGGGTNSVAGALTSSDGELTFAHLTLNGTGDAVTVTGSISGHGTVAALTLGDGAVFAPDGEGYFTISGSLSGTMTIDLSGLDLSVGSTIPLFKTGTAAMLPAEDDIAFASGVGKGGRRLRQTSDGLGYDLIYSGTIVIIH